MKATESLQNRFGWIVTYEGPTWPRVRRLGALCLGRFPQLAHPQRLITQGTRRQEVNHERLNLQPNLHPGVHRRVGARQRASLFVLAAGVGPPRIEPQAPATGWYDRIGSPIDSPAAPHASRRPRTSCASARRAQTRHPCWGSEARQTAGAPFCDQGAPSAPAVFMPMCRKLRRDPHLSSLRR